MEAPPPLTIPLGLELRREPNEFTHTPLMVPTDRRTVMMMMGGGLTNDMVPVPLFEDMLKSVSETVDPTQSTRRRRVVTMRRHK
jgi:hypothetical protein